VYAVAQGPVQAGGFDVMAAGSHLQKNHPTSGTVPGGATVERTVSPDLEKVPLALGYADRTSPRPCASPKR